GARGGCMLARRRVRAPPARRLAEAAAEVEPPLLLRLRLARWHEGELVEATMIDRPRTLALRHRLPAHGRLDRPAHILWLPPLWGQEGHDGVSAAKRTHAR